MANRAGTATLAVGLLGTGFMGRAHSRALLALRNLEPNPPVLPELVAICGRNSQRLSEMKARFGWTRDVENWHDLATDPTVDVFDDAGTNDLHAAPTIAAAQSGKHVICEKPLGRTAAEAHDMLEAARASGVVHMCAFNYRFFPAIRLARELIDAGELGEIHQFRSRFLRDRAVDRDTGPQWRSDPNTAGSGVVGDLLAHHLDLARYLVGELHAVTAATRTSGRRDNVAHRDIDDAVVATVEFKGGAIGTLEASRIAPGHVLTSVLEVDGSKGSLAFDALRPNELHRSSVNGALRVDVTAPGDPFMTFWWPRGHGIGWGDSFVHEMRHFLGACAGTWSISPHGASFEDGYKCALAGDGIIKAASEGRRIEVHDNSGGSA